ncbi:MAG: hypothetical protein HQL74_15955 [Magnetococcales bacterium]|nr:hypothetical protein [Magnetococcales bacterium]
MGQQKSPCGNTGNQQKSPPQSHDPRPVIEVRGGGLPEIVVKAQSVLANNQSVFQQGGRLVRLVTLAKDEEAGGIKYSSGSTVVRHVDPAWLHLDLTRIAQWKKWNRQGDVYTTNADKETVNAVLSNAGQWPFNELQGVIEAPTLRPDGSILDYHGFDQATRLYLTKNPVCLDKVRLENPSRDDAIKALAGLKKLIKTFPFVTNSDLAVALSGILTTVIRRSLPTSPLHAYSAPTPGSGKSKLVELASIIASGRKAPVFNHGKTDDEFEKRLVSAVLAGDGQIFIDNVSRPLGGDQLCQLLTQERVQIRPLGASVQVTVPASLTIFANGKNLVLPEDMVRRSLLCSIDPRCERPELRQFDSDPVKVAECKRDELLTSALIVLRAFHLAGRPGMGLIPLGGFEAWSGWVRAALVWLGEADPCQTMEMVRANDPELTRLKSVLTAWSTIYGNRHLSVREIIEEISRNQCSDDVKTLRASLLEVAGDGGLVNSKRFGKWLANNKQRIADGLQIEDAGISAGHKLWRVIAANGGLVAFGGSVFNPLREKEENKIYAQAHAHACEDGQKVTHQKPPTHQIDPNDNPDFWNPFEMGRS